MFALHKRVSPRHYILCLLFLSHVDCASSAYHHTLGHVKGNSPPSESFSKRIASLHRRQYRANTSIFQENLSSILRTNASFSLRSQNNNEHDHGVPSLGRSAKNNQLSENRLLVFGLGNVGKLVARRGSALFTDTEQNNKLHSASDDSPFFDQVYGTVREKNTNNNKNNNESRNHSTGDATAINDVQTIAFHSHQELRALLPQCTHILVTIPPIDTNKMMISPNSNNNTSYYDNIIIDEQSSQEILFVGGKPREWPREWKFCCDPVLNHPRLSLMDLIQPGTWVGYISSTSVYGNHDGEWVNEASKIKCEPGSKGELYFRAENEWRNAAKKGGWRFNVFRCAGLYGHGRSALHTLRKKMKNGDKIAINEEVSVSETKKSGKRDYPTSRIHEEDVTRAILCSMMLDDKKQPNALGSPACNTWNLSDDDPAPRGDVMAFAAKLLEEDKNAIPQPNNTNEISKGEMMINGKTQQSERERRRKTDRKRVGNQRMKEGLLPNSELLFPTFREGLRDVLCHNRLNDEW